MYIYLYEQFLTGEKHFRTLSTIETILTDMGINGKTFRLSLLNSPHEIIKDQVRKGVRNIVVVGTDRLVCQVIDSLAGYKSVALGIIPLGQPQEIAQTLSVPEGEAACKVLATRLIREIRLAKINDKYFLYQAEIKNPNVVVRCDDKYQISAITPAQIKVYNHPTQDGQVLQTVIESASGGLFKKEPTRSVFSSLRVFIEPLQKKNIKILADDQKEVVAPALIEITDLKLRVIVGKSLTGLTQ